MANTDINVLQTIIQLRRGTEEQWDLVKDTFIPREGEPCTTIYDDGRDALIKIGDGKHTWGELGYTKDSFLVAVTMSESMDQYISDKTYEETMKAIKQNKSVYVKIAQKSYGTTDTFFLPFQRIESEGGKSECIIFGQLVTYYSIIFIFKKDGTWENKGYNFLTADSFSNSDFEANNKRIVNLKDSEDLKSAVTKGYTDNSTPTFIYLEEQDGAIKSKVTDLDTLKTALMSQTDGYTQTNKPLYKAVKCYAVLDSNCYDLIYSSKEPQVAGKKDIVKRTFFAITSNGLNKLSVVVDENQNDENQKVVWTKEAQGVASEQFVVTLTSINGLETWESDKTPAEIKTAAQAGKQVVLKRRDRVGKTETAYLVSVMDEVADFCFIGTNTSIDYDTNNSDIFKQEWITITADKAAKIHREMHTPAFIIYRDGPKWVSTISPPDFFQSGFFGPASNVLCLIFEQSVSEMSGGVLVMGEDYNDFHVYFSDYANNKVYHFKWNSDEIENGKYTYTLTELTLDEKPMIVNFTITDQTTFMCTADKTYEEVDSAYKKGIPIYGRVALGGQQAFLSCSYSNDDNGNVYSFTSLAVNSNFTMPIFTISIFYTSIECWCYLGKLMQKDFIDDSATWNASFKRITKLDSPINDSDAVTKDYADNILVTAKSYADNILTAGDSNSVVIKSSTPDSIKKFRITVDDAGTISATEVVS